LEREKYYPCDLGNGRIGFRITKDGRRDNDFDNLVAW